MKRILVIGAGNIGGALIGGIIKGGVADASHVTATESSRERAAEIADRYGIRVRPSIENRKAVEESDVVVVAVKPHIVPGLLRELSEVLREDQILISVAAAVPIQLIERMIGKRMPVVRAMPNIPVVVDEGAAGIATNSHTTDAQRQFVESIFQSAGVAAVVDEELMHAVTAVSGSGPAYIYMIIEALIAGGVKQGLSHEVATRLAEQTVLGAAKLVRETGLHPAILKDRVTTPGGVTIAAIHELERHGLRSMLISAIETATQRSRDLNDALMAKFEDEHE